MVGFAEFGSGMQPSMAGMAGVVAAHDALNGAGLIGAAVVIVLGGEALLRLLLEAANG